MSSLLDIYHKLISTNFFGEGAEPRPLLEVALETLEDTAKRGGLLILQLPTGYGKTAITYSSFINAVLQPNFFWRVIHVSPLRTLIDDIYRRLVEGFKGDLKDAYHYVNRLAGMQMMYSAGSPYLQKRLVITTFDTFTLALAKVPPQEVEDIATGRGHGHFDVPRASVLESLVVMDEVHSFLSEPLDKTGTSKALQVLMSALHYLVESRVPLVLMTATMPEKHVRSMLHTINLLLRGSSPYYKELYYGKESFIDKDFEHEQSSKNIETKLVGKGLQAFVEQALEYASSYNKLLVVLNTIPRALQVYRELRGKGLNALLLHSKFKQPDRDEKLEKLKSDRWILVSTQVVEVGVDISAEVLVTDVAPANNLVQRAGRVARRKNDSEGIVVIVEDDEASHGYHIYNVNLLNKTIEELRRHSDRAKVKINWRSLGNDEKIGYQDFVNNVYSEDQRFTFDVTYYRLISSYYWTPQDSIRLLTEVYDGSFLRSSPLIPLLVSPSEELTLSTSFLAVNSIPTDLGDIARLLRKGIRIEKILRDKGESAREPLKPQDVNSIVRFIMTGRLIALYMPHAEEVYSQSEGLIP